MMRLLQKTSLLGFYAEWEERVRPGNPFVIEHVKSGKVYSTEPNWPVIVPVAIVLLAALIVGIVFLYRYNVRKTRIPVRFAGKTKYVEPGLPLKHALTSPVLHANWLENQIIRLAEDGVRIDGLYLDADLTVPLDENARVKAPIRIFPKIKQ